MDLLTCRHQTEVRILLRRLFRPLESKPGHFRPFQKTFWMQNMKKEAIFFLSLLRPLFVVRCL